MRKIKRYLIDMTTVLLKFPQKMVGYLRCKFANGTISDQSDMDLSTCRQPEENDDIQPDQFRDRMKTIADLEELEDGWAGPNTISPNNLVIEALNQVFVSLNWKEEDLPMVEIDEIDGSIAMIWDLADGKMGSIDILPDGQVYCARTNVELGKSVCEKIEPTDRHAMLSFFQVD